MNDIMKGYIAGLLDGEGSVFTCFNNNRKDLRPMIEVVSNTNKPFIDLIKKTLEDSGYHTTLCTNRNSQKTNNCLDVYSLRLCRKSEIMSFVDQIVDYAIIKKEKLLILKKICSGIDPMVNREILKTLNKKGKNKPNHFQ